MLVLIFGLQGYLGPFLRRDGYAVMPYLTSLVGAALFVGGLFLFRPRGPDAHVIWHRAGRLALFGGAAAFAVLLAVQLYFEIWPRDQSLKIIFATPGLVLATAFVTFPFVARELIPVMEAIGPDEETAAISLGASGWQMFRRVTLPSISWGLVHGVVLLTARAVGEFGAVSVVSGHIRGQTTTAPLHVEILYNEYQFAGAFAVASILALFALVSLAAKRTIEWRIAHPR
jgi:sulfate transport system permease protein